MPRGWVNGVGREGWEGGFVEAAVGGRGGGARASRGCWRVEMRSSTRRLEARGAMPGRVTVHCWSRVALLRD